MTTAADLDDAAIDDAVTRLNILRRLGDLGMRLAEEIVERAVNSPYHPEPKHEPGRAFASISRAVRLTLALQVRMEDRLIALRKGQTPVAERPTLARHTNDAAPDDGLDDLREPSGRSNENLREHESERFDELVSGPFEDCVAAIRADLGLTAVEALPSAEHSIEAPLQAILNTVTVAPAPRSAPAPTTSTALMRVLTPCFPDSG